MALPMKAESSIDTAEPHLVQSRKEMLDPKLRKSMTLVALPTRDRPTVEQELPSRANCRTDRELPRFTTSSTDKDDPQRLKERRDKADPKAVVSRIEIEELTRANPTTDIELAHLEKHRSDNALPKCAQPKTETPPSPWRTTDRTDKELPRERKSYTLWKGSNFAGL
jgi:hypothetical protein